MLSEPNLSCCAGRRIDTIELYSIYKTKTTTPNKTEKKRSGHALMLEAAEAAEADGAFVEATGAAGAPAGTACGGDEGGGCELPSGKHVFTGAQLLYGSPTILFNV